MFVTPPTRRHASVTHPARVCPSDQIGTMHKAERWTYCARALKSSEGLAWMLFERRTKMSLFERTSFRLARVATGSSTRRRDRRAVIASGIAGGFWAGQRNFKTGGLPLSIAGSFVGWLAGWRIENPQHQTSTTSPLKVTTF